VFDRRLGDRLDHLLVRLDRCRWHGQAGLAVVHTIQCLATTTVFTVSLYIPPDEDFQDAVVLPQHLATASLPARITGDPPAAPHPPAVSAFGDDREAEEMAARWLRRFGHTDAVVTPPGPDNGIDVAARGAVAQIKLWRNDRAPHRRHPASQRSCPTVRRPWATSRSCSASTRPGRAGGHRRHQGRVRAPARLTDRRAPDLPRTHPGGRRILEQARRHRQALYRNLMDGWSQHDRTEFARLLTRFADAMAGNRS